MLKLTLLVAAVVLVGCASSPEPSAAALDAQLPQLIAACSGAAEAGARQEKSFRACATLANEKLLYLVEPVASSAYSEYRVRAAGWQACQRSQSHGLIPVGSRRHCWF